MFSVAELTTYANKYSQISENFLTDWARSLKYSYKISVIICKVEFDIECQPMFEHICATEVVNPFLINSSVMLVISNFVQNDCSRSMNELSSTVEILQMSSGEIRNHCCIADDRTDTRQKSSSVNDKVIIMQISADQLVLVIFHSQTPH